MSIGYSLGLEERRMDGWRHGKSSMIVMDEDEDEEVVGKWFIVDIGLMLDRVQLLM